MQEQRVRSLAGLVVVENAAVERHFMSRNIAAFGVAGVVGITVAAQSEQQQDDADQVAGHGSHFAHSIIHSGGG